MSAHELRPATVAQLLDLAVGHHEDDASAEARCRIGSLGASDAWMAPGLVAELDAGEARRRAEALIGLGCLAMNGGLGEHASAVVARLMRFARTDVAYGNRLFALDVLGRFAARDASVLHTVAEVARLDAHAQVRAAAIRVLGALGLAASPVASVIAEALHDADEDVRSAARVAVRFVRLS